MLGKSGYWDYGGVRYALAFTSDVMFDMMDMTGGDGNIVDLLRGADREAFKRVKTIAGMMAHAAAKRANYFGDTAQEIDPELLEHLFPADYPGLREALTRAILLGYGREIPDDPDEEVDLVLNEIEKKE